MVLVVVQLALKKEIHSECGAQWGVHTYLYWKFCIVSGRSQILSPNWSSALGWWWEISCTSRCHFIVHLWFVFMIMLGQLLCFWYCSRLQKIWGRHIASFPVYPCPVVSCQNPVTFYTTAVQGVGCWSHFCCVIVQECPSRKHWERIVE